MHINERNLIACKSLEAAKRFDRKLTLVPIIFLFLRSWGMMRFCIYLTSSVHESHSERSVQEVLIYFQVSVVLVFHIFVRQLCVMVEGGERSEREIAKQIQLNKFTE